MRVESRVFSLSWVPSDVVSGLDRLPFAIGLAKADSPLPDWVSDPHELVREGKARQANDLRAWVEFDEEGRPSEWGYETAGEEEHAAEIEFPALRQEPEVGVGEVRFVQTAGGRLGGSVPRRVRGKPFMRFAAPIAWTTIELTISSDGSSRGALIGGSPFPRHWLYGADGALQAKSAEADYRLWLERASLQSTPWGDEDSEQFVALAESALERQLSQRIMSSKPRVRTLPEGTMLVSQGDRGDTLFLVLDGVLDVFVGGQAIAEVGPGAIVGERGSLEGRRTATLQARTACRVVPIDPGSLTAEVREQIAAGHRREDD
jgi:Cyclic nucleotide-binding domain